jgi:hypothetical protein
MRVGFFTWAKDWVSIDTLLQVQRIALVNSREKSLVKRVAGSWKIVKLLTESRNPFSLFLYPRIVAAFDFKADVNATQDDIEIIEKRIVLLCSDIASRMGGKMPREVITGMAFDEIENFYKQLILRGMEKTINLMSAYHSPAEFGKKLIDKMRQIQNELEKAQPKSTAALEKLDAFEPVKISEMFTRFA